MKSGRMRRVIWGAVCFSVVLLGALAFAQFGPHASAARGSVNEAAREWRAWRDEADKAGFEGWDALEKAAESVERYRASRYGDDVLEMGDALTRLLTGAWDDPRHGEDKERLGDTSAVVEEILAATGKPFGSWRRRSVKEGDAWTFEEAVPLDAVLARGRMCRLLLVSMRECAARGDWEGVERIARGGMRLARHAYVEGSFMALASSVSVWRAVTRETARVSVEHVPPLDVSSRLLGLVVEAELPTEMGLSALKGERLFQLASLHEGYNRHGFEMTWETDPVEWGPFKSSWGGAPTAWDRVANVRAYGRAGWNEKTRNLNATFDAFEAWANRVGSYYVVTAGIEEAREAERRSRVESIGLGGMREWMKLWTSVARERQAAIETLTSVTIMASRSGEWHLAREAPNPATNKPFVIRRGGDVFGDGAFTIYEREGVGAEKDAWRGGGWRERYREREKREEEEGGAE